MLAIYRKEIKLFFNSLEGYLAISVFFLTTSLIIWYIPSDYNIIYNQEASLLPFFQISPWVLLFLIPAITMKMVSYETIQKTIIILLTKPIETYKIIASKFFASCTIGIISILPSLIFIYSIYELSEPKGNIDQGQLLGSYLGIVFLIATYSAIGLLGSALSKNTMISFITSTLLILLFLFGFDFLGHNYNISFLEYLSINSHYESISRGVIDSRDLIYFMSIIIIFLGLSTIIIQERKS